jgi:hypothetical protein
MLVHKKVSRFYRRHDNNITNKMDLDNHYKMLMLKTSLDRRRPDKKGAARILPKLSDFAID